MSIRLTPVKFEDGSIGFQDDAPVVGILRRAAEGRGVAYHNATAWGSLPAWRVCDTPNPWKEGHRSLLLSFDHVALLVEAHRTSPEGDDSPMFYVPGLSVTLSNGPGLGFSTRRVRTAHGWYGEPYLEYHHTQLGCWIELPRDLWKHVHIDDNNGFPTAADQED